MRWWIVHLDKMTEFQLPIWKNACGSLQLMMFEERQSLSTYDI